MGYDKMTNQTNKGEKMGLDQHAHLRGHKVNWEKYFDDDKEETEKVFVWRKHARLQQFMSCKWAEQNPKVEVEGFLKHLGFNADQEAPCYMTKEVVQELGKCIKNGYKDYVATDGFFWGQQFQKESVAEYKEQDIKFLKFCEQAIDEKKVVEYWCSW